MYLNQPYSTDCGGNNTTNDECSQDDMDNITPLQHWWADGATDGKNSMGALWEGGQSYRCAFPVSVSAFSCFSKCCSLFH